MTSKSRIDIALNMEHNYALRNARIKAQRLVRDMSYNAAVMKKEQERKDEYNKRFEKNEQ